MSMRANVVLPAPRSPESVTRSPRSSALAMSIASRCVARSSGNATEKLAVVGAVEAIMMPEGACRLRFCFARDLFRKPVPTPDQVRGRLFRDHALDRRRGADAHRDRPPTRSRRRSLGGVFERENAGDRGPAADRRLERHRAAVQLHEGAHQGEAEAGAAVARAERMSFEPIEHLVLYVRRNAGPTIG